MYDYCFSICICSEYVYTIIALLYAYSKICMIISMFKVLPC